MTQIIPNLRNQSGVYLPLVAAVVMAILFVIVGLGLDSSAVKRASTALARRNEEICKKIASRPVIEKEALLSYRDQVQATVDNDLVKHVTVIDAKVFLPTMPSLGDFCFEGVPGCVNTLAGQPSPPTVPGPKTFQNAIGLRCTLPCIGASCLPQDCTYLGDATSPQVLSIFPQGLLSNLQNAGNAVGCQMTGKIQTVLSGTRTVSVKSVWSANLNGQFDPVPTTPTFNQMVAKAPGLVIGLSPYFTTRVGERQFRFKDANLHGGNQVHWDEKDVIKNFGKVTGSSGFSNDPNLARNYNQAAPVLTNPVALPTPSLLPENIGYDPVTQLGTARAPDITAGDLPDKPDLINLLPPAVPSITPTPVPGTDYIVPSDREEQLTACSNPAVLLRNEFITVLLDLLARNGQTRNMTKLSLINPRNFELSNNGNLDSDPLALNNPTTIVDFGQDLVALEGPTVERYQIPYIFFNSGTPSTVPVPFSFSTKAIPPEIGPPVILGTGLIDPFLPSPSIARAASLSEHHRAFASQARDCYHLFHSGGQGVPRFDATGDEFDQANLGFEPSVYSFTSSLRPANFPDSRSTLDQDCPWGKGNNNCHQSSASRLLTASEVVDSIGAVQLCPSETRNSIWNGTALQACVKPAPPAWGGSGSPPATFDLRGDMLGFLCAVADPAQPRPGCPNNPMRFTSSPGLFPIPDPLTVDPQFPFKTAGFDPYLAETNFKAPILIVTHERLGQGEKEAIRTLVSSLAFRDSTPTPPRNRQITVVYIPVRELGDTPAQWHQSHDHAVDDFKYAFHADGASTDAENAVFVFSPFVNGCASSNQYQCFRDYWNSMLGEPENNIGTSARTIYYERIIEAALTF